VIFKSLMSRPVDPKGSRGFNFSNMSDKKYWQSFGERNNSEAFQKSTENEFEESLPLEGLDGNGWLDANHPRRDFLKSLGFSTAAATLAASCEIPIKKVVP